MGVSSQVSGHTAQQGKPLDLLLTTPKKASNGGGSNQWAYTLSTQRSPLVLLGTAEWKPMYHPTAEQADVDRVTAYNSGVPHGGCCTTSNI